MIRQILGVIGLVEVLFPKQLIKYGTKLVYDEPEQFRFKEWATTLVRIEGAIFLLFALGVLGSRRNANEEATIEIEDDQDAQSTIRA